MTERILQLNREKTIFWTLIAVLFLCSGFYMYFINSTVHNVVSRQNLENEASQLTLSIGSKEFQYISSRNMITLSLAHSMGFRDATAKTFLAKGTGAQVSFLSH
jgi:hypothetical protein